MKGTFGAVVVGVALLVGAAVGGCEIRAATPPSWSWELVATAAEAHHFINGLDEYTEPHAVMAICANGKGFYLFYRTDLDSQSDWGWQQFLSGEEAVSYLNKTGVYSGDPVAECMVVWQGHDELYLFHRGTSANASWGWHEADEPDDVHEYMNGIDVDDVARSGTVGAVNADKIAMYYRSDVTGEGDWRWRSLVTAEDVDDFLNGRGEYDTAVRDARILVTSAGKFYVFYRD